jgi:phage regulator Rha-like protein
MAKTIETENKEMNRKIRQVLEDYKLEAGDKTPPVTENQEFIFNNTDFTYSICYYKDAKGELRPYYKLSKDLVTLVMFKFKTEKAKEFQLLYIAKFNQNGKRT